MSRGLLACVFTRLNCTFPKLPFGSPNRGVLNTLKNSVRNCSVHRSVNEKFLNKDRSKFRCPSPRTSGSVRGAIRQQDPALAVFGLEALDDTVARSVGERRFTMLVLGLLAGVALVLAAIGIHGVLSYAVTQRTREIGIRMALGAQPTVVRRLVVYEGLMLAAAGAGLGLVAAWALTRGLASLLFGVSVTDPLTFIAVPLGLSGVALLASYVPARRATRVDPVSALRG